MRGWIKLHRQVYDSDLFVEKRVFSKFEAWIDLLLMVNYKDNRVLINSNLVDVKRGQKLTSMKQLADRWKWSRWKVNFFLSLLQDEGMVTYKTTSKYTLVTIENYDFYQSRDHDNQHQTDIKPTTDQHQTNTNKNVKNLKNVKKGEELKTPHLIKGGKYHGYEESTRPPTDLEFFK